MTALLDPPHRPTTDEPDDDQPRCTCGYDGEDELELGPSGDPYCADCRQTFAGLEDQRGFAFI